MTNDLSKALADRVAGLVARYGSVNSTAQAIGIPQSTLDRIVRGERGLPRTETLRQIAEFFETSIDWLITGKGEAPAGIPKGFKEKAEWDLLASEVAAKDAELFAILADLPRSLDHVLTELTIPSFANKYGPTAKWDMPNLKAVLRASREERAAWIKLFRAWIDTVGVGEVRRLVRLHKHQFATRFVVPTTTREGKRHGKKA